LLLALAQTLKVDSGSCSNLKYCLRFLLQPKFQTPAGVHSGQWWHFFRLRLRSCFKLFKSGCGSGSGNFSNFQIRFLFRLRLHSSIQPKFTHVCTYDRTDSCYWKNWKVTPDGSEGKTLNPPESTPALRFHGHLWLRCQAKFVTSAKFVTCYCFSVILLLRIKKLSLVITFSMYVV